jgi:hypothetical protein
MRFTSRLRLKWEKSDESWRFAITAFITARTFYAVWSGIILLIQPVAVHYVEVDEQPAVLFLDLHTNQYHTYLRNIDGNQLSFRSAGENSVTDLQTGSVWNIDSGTAETGFFERHKLTSVRSPEDMFSYFSTKPYPVAWLALWQRFDANWYTSIAEYNYGSIPGDHAFPPLYPLLIRLLMPLTGHAFLAGLLISHAALLYALKLLYDAFAELGDKIVAKRAVAFILLFPTAFFFFSAYTETLFLVFVLLSLRYTKVGAWHWAGLWIFCAILTRVQGLALLASMLYGMWRRPNFLRTFQHWVGTSIPGFGALFYFYFRARYATNIIPSTASTWEPIWHWSFVPPWDGYLYAVRTLLSGRFTYIDFLNWAATSIFIILLVIGWRRLPLEHNLFVTVSLLIMLTRVIETKPLNSMLRYLLTLFPLFFVASDRSSRPGMQRVIVYTCIALNLFLSAEFFGWGWVA